MPDEQNHTDINSLDREAPTGGPDRPSTVDTTEHADLKHRIEVDAADERAAAAVSHEPQPAAQAVAPTPPLSPAQTVSAPSTESQTLRRPGPGILVLQWLTYAFWGWTVLALSGLVALVVNQFIGAQNSDYSIWDVGSGIAYLLAAVIVLFIISIITDLFYAKVERTYSRSTGMNVIMIIHAVIFALCGIGALISSVFGGVSLLIGDGTDSSGAVATIIIGGIIFVIYGFTLLRTLRPKFLKAIALMYWLFMTVAVIVAVAAGVVGPAAEAKLKAEDEVLTSGLPGLAESINEHANSKGKLPDDLTTLAITSNYAQTDDIRRLVDDGLVEYNPGKMIGMTNSPTDFPESVGKSDFQITKSVPIYHYELCVDYKTASGYNDDSYDSTYRLGEGQVYDTTVDTYDHPKGRTCYDVQTNYSY